MMAGKSKEYATKPKLQISSVKFFDLRKFPNFIIGGRLQKDFYFSWGTGG